MPIVSGPQLRAYRALIRTYCLLVMLPLVAALATGAPRPPRKSAPVARPADLADASPRYRTGRTPSHGRLRPHELDALAPST